MRPTDPLSDSFRNAMVGS